MLSDPVTKEIKKYQDIIVGSKFNTDPQSRAMDLLFINVRISLSLSLSLSHVNMSFI